MVPDLCLLGSSDRAPSPTKKKEEEKNKLRGKEKPGSTKEGAEKARGRDKTRTRHSASSGSSRSVQLLVQMLTSHYLSDLSKLPQGLSVSPLDP